jgi:hypothetical protein
MSESRDVPQYGQPNIPTAPSYYPQQYQEKRSTNGLAIASMVLGIVWIWWIGSVLAVVFGHIALSQINQHPSQEGKGMAIAGLVLGYVGLAFLVLFIIVGVSAGSGSSGY